MRNLILLLTIFSLLSCQQKDSAILSAEMDDIKVISSDSMIVIQYGKEECDTLRRKEDGFYDKQSLILSTGIAEATIPIRKSGRGCVNHIRKIDKHNFVSRISEDSVPFASTWFINFYYDEHYNVFRVERSCLVSYTE